VNMCSASNAEASYFDDGENIDCRSQCHDADDSYVCQKSINGRIQ